MIKTVLFIAFCLIAFSLSAQEETGRVRFEHITMADGLPANSANCVIQDHMGFIWFGSFDGLVCYDGSKVVAYTHNPDDPNSFKGRVVGTMMEDNNGDIWIGSESLFRFERSTQHFFEYPDKKSNIKDGFPEIRFMHEDKQGRIWTIRYINNQYLLARFNPKLSSWVYFNNEPGNPHKLAGNSVFSNFLNFSFVEDADGKIWVTSAGKTDNSLQWLDPKTDSFVPYNISLGPGMAEDFKKICGLSSGRKGLLYLSTDYYLKGWFILNPQNGQIKQFKHDDRDTNSLLSDSALSFPFEDRAGFIWISNTRGIDRYDPSANVFTHYISKPGDPSTPIAGPFLLASETPAGDIWFMEGAGMSFYDKKRNRFFRYLTDKKKEDGLLGVLSSAFVDASGMAWFGTYGSGLNKENRITQFPCLSNIPNNKNSLQDAGVNTIYEAPSEPGIIWFGTKTGLDQFDKKTGIYKHYRHTEADRTTISKGSVTAITEDRNNRFWVGTEGGGLNLMDRKKGRFVHFVKDSVQANGLNDNYISYLKPASDSSLWIGTSGAGLDHFDYNKRKFDHYMKADTDYTPELYNLISLYTGPDRQKLAAILHPGDNVNTSAGFEIKQPAQMLVSGMGEITGTNNEDWGWIEDSSGKTVWEMNFANTLKDGFQDARVRVGIINLNPGKYQLRYKSDPHYSYGHWNGAPPYHPELWGIQAFLLNPGEALALSRELVKRYYNGLGSDYVNSITEDASKNLWIGMVSAGGLTKLDPLTGKFKSYIDISKGPASITGSILEDKKTGNIWAGDYAFGLLLMNKSGEILKSYNTSNGLPGNSIFGIIQDEKGILWVSTDNGLCRLDSTTHKFQFFNKKNGLQGLVFNSMAFWKSADGECYFGGENGVNVFYPDQIKPDTTRPRVVLTGLDISGVPATLGEEGQMPVHISIAKEISLPYNLNDLTFHFTGISFNRGSETQFAYRLSPNDQKWVQAGTNRQIRFTSLSPGTYIFTVKAANADGYWNEDGVSIRIRILPPWWKTWWAYFLYTLLFIGALFGFIAYRSAVLKKENKLLEGKVELRTNQLQSSLENLKSTQSQLIQSEKMASLGELTAGIAHEIQNPLNFVNNFSELNTELVDDLEQEINQGRLEEAKAIARDIKENEQKINQHGKRADAIVKGMLQHSRTNTGTKELTDLNSLADEYFRLAYHGLRAKDNLFNATLKTDFEKGIEKINIVPQDIGRVLLNIFNNAFYAVGEKKKSAAPGYEPTVELSIKKTDNQVFISVKDNGSGIPQKIVDKIFQPFFTTKPTGQGTGLGLSMSYDIIRAHGGEIKVNTSKGEFTEFVILLPVHT